MKTTTIADAKAHLSSLLERIAEGEEIVITRRGRPVARIVPPAQGQIPFDLDALRLYIESGPEKPGPTVAEMRERDEL